MQHQYGRGNVSQQGQRISKSAPCSPVKPKKAPPAHSDSFHIIHKVPLGDTPYVKAKHVQLVDKDPDRAVALFWAAINAGDRVDSALKDMAIVMKQNNRPEEAIEAIKSLRNRCSDQAQESLDNVLLDLYKRCGRLDDQISLLKHKLYLIHQGLAFNGKRTKTARSQGKKFQVSIEQETTRLLGNLGWAYMQQNNYIAAEAVYRKALSIEPDNNKMCNLGICLMNQGRIAEAKAILQCVKPAFADGPWGLDSHLKSYERAQEMLKELDSQQSGSLNYSKEKTDSESTTIDTLQSSSVYQLRQPLPNRNRQKDNLVSESMMGNEMSATFLATEGFGPLQYNSSNFSMLDYGLGGEAFGDENMNTNIPGLLFQNKHPPFLGSTPFEMQRHPEALKQKLEPLSCNLSSKTTFPSSTSNINLNIAAPPFFSRTNDAIERSTEPRMPLTLLDRTNEQNFMMMSLEAEYQNNASCNNVAPPITKLREISANKIRPLPRRSLSFGCEDQGGGIDFLNHIHRQRQSQYQVQPQTQIAQNNNKSLTRSNSISLPLKAKGDDPFPDNQEFEEALAALCDSDPLSHEEKVQRRLKVFQDMTANPRA